VFTPGESILLRGLDEWQQVTDAKPVLVVQDDAALIALWLPLGAPTMKSVLIDHTLGTPRRWEPGNWHLEASV
jgi:hypothetical protein